MAVKYLTMVGQLQWLVTMGDLTFMHMQQPCQNSELLLDKEIWIDSKGCMLMPFGLRITQLGN